MDEEDIDSWYDEEKEKALDEYMKALNEKRYKEKTKKLRERYKKLYEKSIHPGFIKKYLIKIRAFTDKLAEKLGR